MGIDNTLTLDTGGRNRMTAWVLLLGLLLASPLWAGPQIQSWSTANGARVLFVEAPELPILDVRVVLDAAGSREAKPGVASLTSSMLT